MDAFVTRCPLCETAFRVTGEQLALANGLVRCGACTHVFDAAKARDDAPPPAPAASAAISAAYIDALLRESPENDDAPGPAAEAPDVAPSDAAPAQTDTTPPAATTADALPPVPPGIVPLPVEVERLSGRRLPLRQWAWGVFCVLALTALAAQYAWNARETWARDARWRPWYEQACALLRCQLPVLRDISAIRSDALAIRPDPARAGVLLVDAVLTNHASFAQPYPSLELQFADINGNVLASNTLAPGDYLHTTRATLMRARESVRVHLELADPGEAAVNYHVYLREN